MRSSGKWHFARTELIEDPELAEKGLRKVVAKLDSACLGMVNYPREYTDDSPRDSRGDRAIYHKYRDASPASFRADYCHCPIPMFHLPNGTRPFVVDTFVSSKLFAHAEFSSTDNEDLKRIWTHAVSKQFDSLLSIYWTRADHKTSFSLSAWLGFDNKPVDRPHARFTSKLRFKKDVEVNSKVFQEMFEQIVNDCGSISVEDTSTSTDSILHWSIDVPDCMDIYPIAQEIEQTISGEKGWGSSPWGMTIYDRLTPIKQVRKGRCFDDLAAQFNELYRNWNTSFDAFYHVDFNPYADPEIIPAESMEIRLPLGKLRRRNVHFDIIHAADGSFIELRSPTRNSIKRVGKEAGLELNEWCRDSSQRWLSKEQ